MNFKVLPFLLLLFISMQTLAQTKRIAHKSHSGSKATFKMALEKKLFDIESSNFGMAPTEFIQTARLDSLKFISDSVAVMVTSKHCKNVPFGDSTRVIRDRGIWRAGTDTVFNHPLFSKQHELDVVKSKLKDEYYFQNPIEEIVFVGYDNVAVKEEPKQVKKKKKKKRSIKSKNKKETTKSIVPITLVDKAPPSSPQKIVAKSASLSTWFYIGIIALLSLLIGTVARQIQVFKKIAKDFTT